MFKYKVCYIEASRVVEAQMCDCKRYWLWVQSPLKEIKYLFKFTFSFLRSAFEAERGVKFHHSTRNASRIRQKMGNGVS